MKKYIEPEIEITEYRLDDAIAASLLNGTESGNEFNTGKKKQHCLIWKLHQMITGGKTADVTLYFR